MRAAILVAAALAVAPGAGRAEEALRPVVSEIVTSEAAHLRSFPGVVAARVETTLAFQTPGRMQIRRFSVGDRVARAQVLARLDQITLSEDVSAAQAAVNAAQAQAEFAAQSLARAEELRRREVASEAVREAAQAKADAARAALRAAQADLVRAVDAARYGTLRAPASGVVVAAYVEPGTMVAAGTPVLSLATEEGRDVLIDVPQEVLAVIAPESRFVITPRIEGGAPMAGTLRLIEPVAEGGTRARRLRIALEDAARAPRLGALVDVRLDLPEVAALSLPRAAVFDTGEGARVWRVGPGRRAEAVAVTIVPGPEGRVLVTQGLAAGDEILIRGIHSVTPGQELGAREE